MSSAKVKQNVVAVTLPALFSLQNIHGETHELEPFTFLWSQPLRSYAKCKRCRLGYVASMSLLRNVAFGMSMFSLENEGSETNLRTKIDFSALINRSGEQRAEYSELRDQEWSRRHSEFHNFAVKVFRFYILKDRNSNAPVAYNLYLTPKAPAVPKKVVSGSQPGTVMLNTTFHRPARALVGPGSSKSGINVHGSFDCSWRSSVSARASLGANSWVI
ncbi:hypothetical protein WG66_009372 [Moniliophthora roreri]|nr:hypothetical protein WG66_009372 [Moniliophthora roreri]